MNVSPNELRKETVKTLREVEDSIEETPARSTVMATLLLAKAQCLQTLVLLNEKR